MLTILRDATGQLQAACEWVPADYDGTPMNDGHWVWINQLELSQGVNGIQVICQLIERIAEQMPKAIGAYWMRADRTGKQIHWYSRVRLLRGGVRV